MHMDKTKFAKETGSEEIDLRSFIDDECDENENFHEDDDFIPKLPAQRLTNASRSDGSQVNLANKVTHQISTASTSTITYDQSKYHISILLIVRMNSLLFCFFEMPLSLETHHLRHRINVHLTLKVLWK